MYLRHILIAFLVLFGLTACGSDEPDANTCTTDSECELGTVCSATKTCVSATCDFCTPLQVCYKATPTSEGSCSKPQCSTNTVADDCRGGETCSKGLCVSAGTSTGECTKNEDCDEGERCNISDQCVADVPDVCTGPMDCPNNERCVDEKCVGGCSLDIHCADSEFCAADDTCQTGCRENAQCAADGKVCNEGTCECNATSCPDGKACLADGNCGEATSCEDITCSPETVCNPVDFACIPKCTPETCNVNEICNEDTGACEITNCPGDDPNQCDGEPTRNKWNAESCFCAECLEDDECNVAAGETCNAGGKCFACETACDGSAGSCGGATPFCVSECCVACVSTTDCPNAGDLCIEGACTVPPSCTADPNICPSGTVCSATGTCEPETGGNPGNLGSCTPGDTNSCPGGNVCNQFGLCACDPVNSPECPSGQMCLISFCI